MGRDAGVEKPFAVAGVSSGGSRLPMERGVEVGRRTKGVHLGLMKRRLRDHGLRRRGLVGEDAARRSTPILWRELPRLDHASPGGKRSPLLWRRGRICRSICRIVAGLGIGLLSFFLRSPPLVGEDPSGVVGVLEAPVEEVLATRAAAAELDVVPAVAPVARSVLAASILWERSRRVSSCRR